MMHGALLRLSPKKTWRSAVAAAALVTAIFGGCAAPSGGLPPSYVAQPPLPGEARGQTSSATSSATAGAVITDVAAGLLFIADFGGGPGQQEIADSMLAWKQQGHRVDAVITAGDNVYPKGQESGIVPQVEHPYQALGVPILVALGNHDVQTVGGRRLLAHFGMPQPPSVHRFGPVEIFVLDSNRVDAAQASWLRERLNASEAKTRVIVFHHPVFSCGPHGSTSQVQKLWLPVIEEAKPELIVNGHDHNYQRIIQRVDQDTIVYAVTGGGGRELTGAKAGCDLGSATPRRIEPRHQFLSLEVRTDGTWILRAVTGSATVFDTYEGQSRGGSRE